MFGQEGCISGFERDQDSEKNRSKATFQFTHQVLTATYKFSISTYIVIIISSTRYAKKLEEKTVAPLGHMEREPLFVIVRRE